MYFSAVMENLFFWLFISVPEAQGDHLVYYLQSTLPRVSYQLYVFLLLLESLDEDGLDLIR